MRMVRELVPDGRTHRLAVMLAGILQYAVVMAAAKSAKERHGRSLVASLLEVSEANDPSEVEDLIDDAVVQLFKDAKVRFERTSARGVKYSLAEEAYEELIHWHDMPGNEQGVRKLRCRTRELAAAAALFAPVKLPCGGTPEQVSKVPEGHPFTEVRALYSY